MGGIGIGIGKCADSSIVKMNAYIRCDINSRECDWLNDDYDGMIFLLSTKFPIPKYF